MKELLMRSGCKVPFPEQLFECYTLADDRVMANVGADKLPSMLKQFIGMHDEPLFFILELPTNKKDEPDIEHSLHTYVYYIYGLTQAEATDILARVGDILYSDGIAAFGFGCPDSGDEFFSIEYNSVVLFSKNPEKYELFFVEHDIPKTDNYICAWDIVSDEHPAESFAVTVGGKTIYDIPEMLKDMGVYLAERRER